MSANEIVDALLKALEILTKWPLILFYLVLIFRTPLSVVLPDLLRAITDRIKTISVGGVKIELETIQSIGKQFTDPAAFRAFLLNLRGEALSEGEDSDVDENILEQEELVTEEDVDEEDSSPSDIEEYQSSLDELENR